MRYFSAVIAPVMRDKTPSIETFPDTVKRQKLYNQLRDAFDAKHPSKMTRAELAAIRLLELGRTS